MLSSDNSLFFKENFRVCLNRDTDPMFLTFDYDIRDYNLNMDLQHYHNFYEIFIALEDSVAHLLDGRYFQMRKHDIVFLRPNLLHMSIYPKIYEPQKRIIIDFNLGKGIYGLERIHKRLLNIFDQDPPILRFSPDIQSEIIHCLNEIFIIGNKKQKDWEIAFYIKFTEFLWLVDKYSAFNCYAEETAIESTEQKIYDVINYINTHFMDDLSLDNVAERFSISSFYLSHLFKKISDQNFVNYIQTVRIRNVLQKLAYSDVSISEIIESCGFTSASQFNRVFQNYCGMSPSSYRKSHKSQRDALISKLYPEITEKAIANYPPQVSDRAVKKKKIFKIDKTTIGVVAHDLEPRKPLILHEYLKRNSIDTIELCIPNSFPYTKSYSNISRMQLSEIADQQFNISVLSCDMDISCNDDNEWNNNIDELSHAIKIGNGLKAKCVSTRSGKCLPEERDEKFKRLVKALEILLPIAEQYETPLAIEPAFTDTICDIKTITKLIETCSSDYLKLIFSPVDLLNESCDNNTFMFFKEIIKKFEDYFMAMHIKDILDNKPVDLGKGIMIKTYPFISKQLTVNIPIIRDSLSFESGNSDLEYIKSIFM